MLFSSLTFLYIFLPILCILYFIIKNPIWRRAVLTVFSLIFYSWGEPIFVLLMIGSVSVNYLAGRFIGKTDDNVKKKAYMIISVALNLAILGIFKYIPMIVQTLNLIPFVSLSVPNVPLPLGISFYTFQAMSYMIDVYRGDTPYQKSFLSLLLYVSFFPQLIAGPIVRYKDIAEQIPDRTADIDSIFDGIYRFSVGLSKKIILANPCGEASEALLGMTVSESVIGKWVGILFFALQIYFDFSGYSDMAIGLGLIFGFRFKENFDYPYMSKSATEFWRRWHISLGAFFRDYIYIPLGGNRKRWFFNVFAVWFLTGLWHGASWNFVLWGVYYACLLVFEKKVLFKLWAKIPKIPAVVFQYIYTAFITLIGWTIFYFTDFSVLLSSLFTMFGLSDVALNDLFVDSVIKDNIVLLILALLFAFPLPKLIFSKLGKVFNNEGVAVAAKTVFVFASLFVSTAMLAGNSYNPFLYFRF
ncbi:MAG: MBOAT family protein [Ruminococcaceae bacterium]|nr:MBOAT family protein [Oscillospiraceae bacterium]